MRADFDKQKLETNLNLDEFYAAVPKPRPEVSAEVINPSKILRDIQKKLSPIELLVLRTYPKKI